MGAFYSSIWQPLFSTGGSAAAHPPQPIACLPVFLASLSQLPHLMVVITLQLPIAFHKPASGGLPHARLLLLLQPPPFLASSSVHFTRPPHISALPFSSCKLTPSGGP
ncbi:hypothetical protein GOP47_0023139, partial [Adiantum capillus-veneris]